MLSKEKKLELIKRFGANDQDTGKPEVQIAMLTEHMKQLSEHLLTNKKDNHNKRGLIMMVSKRRKLLKYLEHVDIQRYRAILQALNLRK
jgi:small subunit ribosomal protein S15